MIKSPMDKKINELLDLTSKAFETSNISVLSSLWDSFSNVCENAIQMKYLDIDKGMGFTKPELIRIRNSFFGVYSAVYDQEISFVRAKSEFIDLEKQIRNLKRLVEAKAEENSIGMQDEEPVVVENKPLVFNSFDKIEMPKLVTADSKKHSVEVLEIEKKNERLYRSLKKYKEEMQKLKTWKIPGNDVWGITKGPVLFACTPLLLNVQLQRTGFDYTGLSYLPRPNQEKSTTWVLDNQILLGFKSGLSDAEFSHTLELALKVLESRFHHLTVMTPSTNQKIKVPKLIALPSSSIKFVWVMQTTKYNKLPPIKVNLVGFPTVENMRSLHDRLENKVETPSLLSQVRNMESKSDKFNKKVDEAHHELNVQVQDLLEKKNSILENIKRYNNMIEAEKSETIPNENEIARLIGERQGYLILVKSINEKIQLIEAEKTRIFKNLSQQEREENARLAGESE